MSRMLLSRCAAIATMDDAGTELAGGSILVEDGAIAWLGTGDPPAGLAEGADVVDASGCVAIPGLVNTHHHLYQVLTRARAQQDGLFGWLTELYPVWAGLDAEWVGAAAGAGLAELALSGCSTSTDHHYVFPAGRGDLLGAEIQAARELGIRFHPTRGSMDLGASQGGLPPDVVTQDADIVLAETEQAIATYHDPSPGAMVRIAVAPCSPFSASERLMRESVALARRLGVRLHTHIAETSDEEAFCLERFGCRPVELLDRMGFLGDDVWLAHAVHLSRARHHPARGDPHRDRPLPHVQHAPRVRHGPGSRARGRGRARRHRRGRLGLERRGAPAGRGAAGDAGGAWSRRAGSHDRARGPVARDQGRGRVPRA